MAVVAFPASSSVHWPIGSLAVEAWVGAKQPGEETLRTVLQGAGSAGCSRGEGQLLPVPDSSCGIVGAAFPAYPWVGRGTGGGPSRPDERWG